MVLEGENEMREMGGKRDGKEKREGKGEEESTYVGFNANFIC